MIDIRHIGCPLSREPRALFTYNHVFIFLSISRAACGREVVTLTEKQYSTAYFSISFDYMCAHIEYNIHQSISRALVSGDWCGSSGLRRPVWAYCHLTLCSRSPCARARPGYFDSAVGAGFAHFVRERRRATPTHTCAEAGPHLSAEGEPHRSIAVVLGPAPSAQGAGDRPQSRLAHYRGGAIRGRGRHDHCTLGIMAIRASARTTAPGGPPTPKGHT